MLYIDLRPVIFRSGFALGAEDGKADADSQGDDRGKRNDEESHDACPPMQ